MKGLDRWHVQVNPSPFRHFGIQLPSHDFYMQNYVSIGKPDFLFKISPPDGNHLNIFCYFLAKVAPSIKGV